MHNYILVVSFVKFYLFSIFFTGDIVSLSLGKGTTSEDGIASGVVTSVTATSIYVSFEESVDDLSLAEDESYKIIKLANDVTYKRLKRYLRLIKSRHDRWEKSIKNSLCAQKGYHEITPFIRTIDHLMHVHLHFSALDFLRNESSNHTLASILFGASTLSPPLQDLSGKIKAQDGDIKFQNGK